MLREFHYNDHPLTSCSRPSARSRRPEPVRRASLRAIAGAIAGLALAAPAAAQDWPARPVRIVSPFAAGGSSDTMGRVIAQQLGEQLHQPFYVENRGGAGGLIGSGIVANAAPDGYTFLISSIGTHVIAPLTAPNPGLRPGRELYPRGLRGRSADRDRDASVARRALVRRAARALEAGASPCPICRPAPAPSAT